MKLPVLAQIEGRCDLGHRDLHESFRAKVGCQLLPRLLGCRSINALLSLIQATKSSVDEINDLKALSPLSNSSLNLCKEPRNVSLARCLLTEQSARKSQCHGNESGSAQKLPYWTSTSHETTVQQERQTGTALYWPDATAGQNGDADRHGSTTRRSRSCSYAVRDYIITQSPRRPGTPKFMQMPIVLAHVGHLPRPPGGAEAVAAPSP